MPTGFGKPQETILTKIANYTVNPGDDVILADTTSGPVTITLYTPVGNYAEFGQTGNSGIVRIINIGATGNALTVATAAGSITGVATFAQANSGATYQSDGIGTWYTFGAVPTTYEIQVPLSSVQILALNATPVTLVPAPGAGKVVVVESILLKMVTTATQYANGGALEFRYTNASGAKVTADIAAAVVTAGAGTSYTSVAGVTTSLTNVANAAIVVDNATGAFTTGTGTATITIKFRIVTP